MQRAVTTISLLTLLAGLALSRPAAASPGDSTNGHGAFNSGTFFVFDAKEKGDGSITGRARFSTTAA